MTLPAAKKVFAHLMEVSQKRELGPLEKRTLIRARQVIRQAKKNPGRPGRGKPLSALYPRRKRIKKSNPHRVQIYKSITRIEGTKGKDSKYPGEKFFHNFTRPYPAMFGLPNGDLLIKRGSKS